MMFLEICECLFQKARFSFPKIRTSEQVHSLLFFYNVMTYESFKSSYWSDTHDENWVR